jgi:hypothetical protein
MMLLGFSQQRKWLAELINRINPEFEDQFEGCQKYQKPLIEYTA